MEMVIELQDVYKIYRTGDAEVRALDGASLTVKKGEFVAVIGRSGSGKSTLMNILGCLDLPTAGVYRLDGETVAEIPEKRLSALRNRHIGFIFQSFHLLPALTALENVELPLSFAGMSRSARRERAEQMLAAVGLADRMHHYPAQMSGGQQQRVAVARAMAGAPSILLADEPTGNLDEQSGAAVMALLQQQHAQGTTVILITHDPQVASLADRRVEMRAGRLFSV